MAKKTETFAPVKAPPKKTVHVLVLEHYHFPKEGTDDWSGDLVAATPLLAVGGSPEDGDYLRIQAHRKAAEQAAKYYKGDPPTEESTAPWVEFIKEGRTSNEYRVWVESGNANQDRFVWVVREVEYK